MAQPVRDDGEDDKIPRLLAGGNGTGEEDDSDEDDEDYNPDRDGERHDDSDAASGGDSAIDSDEARSEDEETAAAGGGPNPFKRRSKGKKKSRKRARVSEPSSDSKMELKPVIPEKTADELWKELNEGLPDSGVKSDATAANGTSTTSSSSSSGATSSSTPAAVTVKDEKVTITEEFDFAGETVKVTKEVSASEAASMRLNPTTTASSSNGGPGASTAPPPPGPPRRSGAGLSSLVASLGQKKKIGTLQKSALDWQSYKSREGIEDELKNAAQNRDGFLERQAFLQRADLKQFEAEKSVRDRIRRLNSK